MEKFAEEQLKKLWEATNQFPPSFMIGSAGTFDTLRDMDLAKNKSMATKSYQLKLTTYQQLHQQMLISNRIERMKIQGMIEERVDMVVVASALLNYVLKKLSLQFIKVSNSSLKEGVLQQIKKGKIELLSLN